MIMIMPNPIGHFFFLFWCGDDLDYVLRLGLEFFVHHQYAGVAFGGSLWVFILSFSLWIPVLSLSYAYFRESIAY